MEYIRQLNIFWVNLLELCEYSMDIRVLELKYGTPSLPYSIKNYLLGTFCQFIITLCQSSLRGVKISLHSVKSLLHDVKST